MTVATVSAFVTSTGSARAQSAGGVRQLGSLELPTNKDSLHDYTPVAIDVARRRVYVRYTVVGPVTHIVEYDLSRTIPRLLRDVVVPVVNPNANNLAFDDRRGVAYILDNRNITETSNCPGCSYISVLHLDTMRLDKEVMNISRAVPNFFGEGLTYSPSDDRLYVVGSPAGPASFATTIEVPPALPTGVVAITVPSLVVAWSRLALPQCQIAALSGTEGASIFRSTNLNALYIPCVRPDGPGHFLPYPGQAGLVRLSITPTGTAADAQRFGVEFFPVSGAYTDNGGLIAHAAFDSKSERLYLVSSSVKTPGAWVFDGLLPAWVGFVAAHDNDDQGLAVDQVTGHFFLRSGSDSHLIVTDSRATPVPQGNSFAVDAAGGQPTWPIDTATHRLFVQHADPKTSAISVVAIEDDLPSGVRTSPLDYDSLTTQIAENDNTIAAFSGNASGFGMRAMLVGGYGGLIDPVTGLDLPIGDTVAQLSNGAVGLSPGGRGITASQVGSVQLLNVGAAASAQSLALDPVSTGDYTNKQDTIRGQGNSAQKGIGDQLATALNWPWPAATCLDAADTPVQNPQSGPTGQSKASCDIAKQTTSATTSFGSLGVGGIAVASSSFSTDSTRDKTLGTVSHATAIAKGIVVTIPGAGTLTIGDIEATASTAAHGRRGTARAAWSTTLENVSLVDTTGKVLYHCGDSCSPKSVAQQVNTSLLAVKLRILLPAAEIISSPGGAAAIVQKAEADYWSGLTLNDDKSREVPAMQLEVYNDSGQKSRLVVQLAAIQLDSIYGISVRPAIVGPDDAITNLANDTFEVLGSFTPAPPLPYQAPPAPHRATHVTQPVVKRVAFGSGILVRSPRDAVLFAFVCVLFAGCVATVQRRHRLLAELEEVGRR